MNKKTIIILVILITLAIIISQILKGNNENIDTKLPSIQINSDNKKTVQVTDAEKIERIKKDSYLNILLQIKTFDSLNISYEPLLEAAMRIAGELNLYQTPENSAYIEYVPRSTIHELIYELSGIKIEDPIIIEDFYYLYNNTEDYYYIVPIGSNWLELKDLSSILYSSDDNKYIINCSAESSTDYDTKTVYPNIELELEYKPNNKYIKYKLFSIDAGKSNEEPILLNDVN